MNCAVPAQIAGNGNAVLKLPVELQLLLACGRRCLQQEDRLRINRLLSNKRFNWDFALTAAQEHGLIPLVSSHLLSEFADGLPKATALELSGVFRRSVNESLLLGGELVKVARLLGAAGVRTLAYKGPMLALALYGNIGLRQSCDVDVLIARRDYPIAKEALLKAGYAPLLVLAPSQEPSYLAAGCEMQFNIPACNSLLEIQWQIVPRYFSVDFELDKFFGRSERVEFAGTELETLSPEDTALTLAVHGGKHAWSRLCWACDFAEILRRQDINWEFVRQEAERLGVRSLLAVAAEFANRLLDAPVPYEMRGLVAEHRHENFVAELCHKLVQHESTPQTPNGQSFRGILLQARLRERWRDRIRMFYRLAVTPSVSEWSAVKLPATLSPVYVVVRSLRLLKTLLTPR